MLSVKDKGLLLHIVDHCLRVEETVSGISREAFDNSKDIKDIVCFNIFQIGELAVHLSPEFAIEYHGVPWEKIRGMRNRIGHGYGTIDWDRVWYTATNDINPLRDYCESITKEN